MKVSSPCPADSPCRLAAKSVYLFFQKSCSQDGEMDKQTDEKPYASGQSVYTGGGIKTIINVLLSLPLPTYLGVTLE